MLMMMQQAADEGLTLHEVLSDIPHDAGAMVVYALMLLFVGFIWYGSRRRPTDGKPGEAPGGEHS